MPERENERWIELCEQVVAEKDSQKLMRLVREMIEVLDKRLKKEAKEETELNEVQ